MIVKVIMKMTEQEKIRYKKLKFQNIIYKEFIKTIKQKANINIDYDKMSLYLMRKLSKTEFKVTNKEAFIVILKKLI